MSEVKLVSVDKQRKKITVTPTGWVVIAVVGLLVVTGVGWGVWKITRGVSVQPLAAAPEVVPTVEPTVMPAVAEDEGNAVPDAPDLSDVDDLMALREDFLGAWTWLYASETPHNVADVSLYFAPVPGDVDEPMMQRGTEWWYGLDTVRADLEADAEEGLLWRVVLSDGEWVVRLDRHGEGWAVVQGQYEGSCAVEAVDTQTGSLVVSDEGRCMRYVAGMVWDGKARAWKIASLWQMEPLHGEETPSE